MSVLRPFSRRRFGLLTCLSLCICNALYVLIALTSIIAFGDDLQEDALRFVRQNQLLRCGRVWETSLH